MFVERFAGQRVPCVKGFLAAALGAGHDAVEVEPGSGTEMTKLFADALGRPCLVVSGPDDADEVRSWIEELGHGISLNVAGPRESKCPGTYHATLALLETVLG